MKVTITNAEQYGFSARGLEAVVRRYRSPLMQRAVFVVFDEPEPLIYGQVDVTRRGYEITLNPHELLQTRVYAIRNRKPVVFWERYDSRGALFETIAALLHELRHCQQHARNPQQYWSKHYDCRPDIRHTGAAAYYSPAECDARAYEASRVQGAVQLYCKIAGGAAS